MEKCSVFYLKAAKKSEDGASGNPCAVTLRNAGSCNSRAGEFPPLMLLAAWSSIGVCNRRTVPPAFLFSDEPPAEEFRCDWNGGLAT